MQKTLWMLAIGFCAMNGAVLADELVMPQASSTVDTDTAVAPAASEESSAVQTTTDSPSVTSETEATTDVVTTSPLMMPTKGETMAEVTQQFGKPKTEHKPAGGDSPKHPAITRWDYEDFSVFFERNKVIDSVNHRKPAKIHHTDELKPLEY